MTQLIITIIAIALSALLALVGLQYAPWWYETADAAESTTTSSLRILEQAYDVATRANNGVPPAVTSELDGGFVSVFTPVLKLLPPAPPQFQWKYGEANGLHFFCMESTSLSVNEGVTRGLFRVKSLYSASQVFINSTCGAQSNIEMTPTATPALALTMYVAFVPGISK